MELATEAGEDDRYARRRTQSSEDRYPRGTVPGASQLSVHTYPVIASTNGDAFGRASPISSGDHQFRDGTVRRPGAPAMQLAPADSYHGPVSPAGGGPAPAQPSW